MKKQEGLKEFLPRMARMNANAGAGAWVLAGSQLRHLIHGFPVPWDFVPRMAFRTGCFSRPAWNASPSSALIRWLGLKGGYLPVKEPCETPARELSRTPVSKQGSVEQACLQSGDLRRSPCQARA